MSPESRLVPSLFFGLAVIAGAVFLWAPEMSNNLWGWEPPALPQSGLGLDLLLWPVVAAAAAPFLVDLVFRVHGSRRARRLLRLPPSFKPALAVAFQMARQLSWDVAWMTLLVGFLAVAAETQEEPAAYYSVILALWAALAILAMTRTARIPLPVINRLFRFPLYRLLGLGAVFILLQSEWAETHGLDESPLLLALAVAAGASFLSGILTDVSGALIHGENRDIPLRLVFSYAANLLASAGVGLTLAALGWGILSIMPSINSVIFAQWPDSVVGRHAMPYLGHLHGQRDLAAQFLIAVGFAANLRPVAGASPDVPYIAMLKAVCYAVAAYLAWMLGNNLAPLGHGAVLLGTAAAAGLLAVASAVLVRPLLPEPGEILTNAARWFSESATRAFSLGASLVLYALLVRPMIYEMLLFAPVLEWLMVAPFVMFAIGRIRSGVRDAMIRERADPPAWNNWSGHELTVEPKTDPRMESLLSLRTRFVSTGEWGQIWRYLMGLMLRNDVQSARIPAVFVPLRRCFLDSSSPGSSSRKKTALTRRREAALDAAFAAAGEALASSTRMTTPENVPQDQLREAAHQFVEGTSGPEQLAVTLTIGYWRQGADLNTAVALWFPLMTYSYGPAPGRGVKRLFNRIAAYVSRRRVAVQEQERRQRMVDGALSHLSGAVSLEELSVAVLDQPLILSEYVTGTGERRLMTGSAVEVTPSLSGAVRLRPAEDRRFYQCREPVRRRPILPGDGAVVEREEVTV